MKKAFVFSAVICLFIAGVVSAITVQGIDLDFVTIGNPGNLGDTTIMVFDGTSGYGGVDYTYQIGKHEITNGQWNAFVSTAGVPTGNLSDAYVESAYYTGTNIPTNEVSWYEAAQFCNYLTSGDKSKGAYQFSGNNTNPGDFLGVDRDSSILTYGTTYVIPTEDEWYKAAYYTGSGYSTYASGTDTTPVRGVDTNYDYAIEQPWDVGDGTEEQNGTYDIMGNVWEWTETEIGSNHCIRGGCYEYLDLDDISSSYRGNMPSFAETPQVGFRVASVIPEPATLLLLGMGGLLIRKRK